MAYSLTNNWLFPSEDKLNLPFLISEDRIIDYREAICLADEIWKGCDRGVALFLCSKDVGTVLGYFGAMRKNIVPLLCEAELKSRLVLGLINAYRPAYIFADKGLHFDGYVTLRKCEGKTVYVAQNNSAYAIYDSLALLLLTSGSTGSPKAVRIGQKALQVSAESICLYLKMSASRRAISNLPFHYSYGLSVLNIVIASSASMVISKKSLIEKSFWELMETHNVTDFSGVPFMFETLKRMKFSEGILRNLQCVTQAGGRLDAKLAAYFRNYFKAHGIEYFTMYGQTEASPRISYLHPDDAISKEGSVGKPIKNGSVSINKIRAEDDTGELIYKGENVCLGYASTYEDLCKEDEFKGILNTGDVAKIDNNGFIFLVGRKNRYIKVNGVSVGLDELETSLSELGVSVLAVGNTNKLVLCTLNKNGKTLNRLLEENFNFHPSNISCFSLDCFPVKANGKPDYTELERRYL